MEKKYKNGGLEAKMQFGLSGGGLEGVLGGSPFGNSQLYAGGNGSLGPGYADVMKLIAGLVMYALSVYGTVAYLQGYNAAGGYGKGYGQKFDVNRQVSYGRENKELEYKANSSSVGQLYGRQG